MDGAGPMQSVCVAFGLERWVHAFLAQHGLEPSQWPEVVRAAPEFGGRRRAPELSRLFGDVSGASG
jgi:hypothetical protein